MLTDMVVSRDGATVHVGDVPAHPARTAVLEARGALLHWDVLDEQVLPSAQVWDLSLAREWLWEVYGEAAADSIATAVPGSITLTDPPSPVALAARRAAVAKWSGAWWPASFVAGVPALDPALVATDLVLALASVEHLLDDEEAVERSLPAALAALPVLEAATHDTSGEWAEQAGSALAGLRTLAEDLGVEPGLAGAPPPAGREDFALVAGTSTPDAGVDGTVVASGTAPVDPARVAAGSADVAAEAWWRLVRGPQGNVVHVGVPRAPRIGNRPNSLDARFAEHRVELVAMEQEYAGSVVVPASVLLLPAEQRTLSVSSPGFEDRAPLPSVDRDALLTHARARLVLEAGELSIAEAEASRRGLA